MSEVRNMYVQYGCWKDAPPGWLNYDCSPYLRVDRIPLLGSWLCNLAWGEWDSFPKDVRFGDIVRGLPLADNCCDGVYCSHVLEHLCLFDARIALRETWRLLRVGGRFRAVVPDLEYLVHQYCELDSADAAESLMLSTGLGETQRVKGIRGAVKEAYGNSRHRWMWDFSSLRKECESAGFVRIRRAKIGDSEDSRFRVVEKAGRWENCLGIEAVKG